MSTSPPPVALRTSIAVNGRTVYEQTHPNADERRAALNEVIARFYTGDYRTKVVDNNGLLHLAACGWLLHEHRDRLTDLQPHEIGAVLGSRSGCYLTDVAFAGQLTGRRSPRLFVQSLPNIAYSQVANCFGLAGEHLYLLQDRHDPRQLRRQADLLLEFGGLHACITGWIETGKYAMTADLQLVTR